VTGIVYVANNVSNTVSVINGRTGTVTATITVGSGAAQAGFNPMTDTVYVTNTTAGTLSVIRGRTGTVTATVTVGSVPVGVGVNPMTGTVYVANNGSGNVSVIPPAATSRRQGVAATSRRIGRLPVTSAM
jgi:YVTN family beta-propeller protein